jgi:hypothetical protein
MSGVGFVNLDSPRPRVWVLLRRNLETRSEWPRDLRRGCSAARLLGLRVRILPGIWMFVCFECCVLSVRGLCDGLNTCPEESYRLWCVWVWSWIVDNEEALAHWGPLHQEDFYEIRYGSYFFSQGLSIHSQFHETAQCGSRWLIGRANMCYGFHISWPVWPNCDVQIFPRSAGFSHECCQNCAVGPHFAEERKWNCACVVYTGLAICVQFIAPDVDKVHCLRAP